jgi:hypothetical protein
MRTLLLLFTMLLALALGAAQAIASAAAPTFVASPGTAVPAEWAGWAARNDAPNPAATIQSVSDALCAGPVPGCSVGPAENYRAWGIYASSRDSLYFELGHIFDWSTLTGPDRRFLARKWGDAGWHWSDSQAAILAGARFGVGVEDGLEGIFAAYYDDCAWGHDTRHTDYSTAIPAGLKVDVPDANSGAFDTCAYLRRIAARPSLPATPSS